LLELKKLYHYYGKAKTLEELNLNLEEENLDSVIGPNGAGKSTILRVISGLEEIDRGKVEFLGKRIDELKAHKIARMGISQCPERRRLFYDMSVADNLKMGAYLMKKGKGKKIGKEKSKELLEFIYEIFPRLKERRKQRAGTLSGGEQQMLAIARSLLSNPKLLLMDEPSIGLAPRVKKKIFNAILQIKAEGKTILLVEQDAVLAMAVSDTIHVLEEGKIEMRGTKEELEREPRIREIYLGI
jgi:branched-chain amino acid transport system ATP-binding protein